jgi:hypothetical protein
LAELVGIALGLILVRPAAEGDNFELFHAQTVCQALPKNPRGRLG